ncbi:15753_t:CDS:2 [Acaulospora morrowiae]|uniref:polynucleotide adenylyltransferase n=1 Tax=Acaulospora morrowiae TaxID=94023 RepID=A0A9N8ZRB2_9GLOM|nr:15753_t:CDS:2 [Acaulospora morrowiae]
MVQPQSQKNNNGEPYGHCGYSPTLMYSLSEKTSSGNFSCNPSYKQGNGSINTNNNAYYRNHRFLNNNQSQEQDSYSIADGDSQQKKEEDSQDHNASTTEFDDNASTTKKSLAATLQYGQNNHPITLPPRSEDSLCVDMLVMFEALLPTKESFEKRKQFVDKIERILNEEWPGHDIKVHLFGSSVNLLGTSNSDVDICVTTPWSGLRNVVILGKGMKKHGMQRIYCVPKAKVPIVRLWDPDLNLYCDINVNNTLALHNTRLIKTYVEIDPRVRPLAMVIKYWAKRRVLNDAAKGGTLSTYTWTCMILNFLQMREPPILPVLHQIPHKGEPIMVNGIDASFYEDVESLRGFGESNKETVGGLLFAFFRRFAYEFDYDHNVISLRQGKYLTKEEKGWGETGKGWRLLCVEEPFNTSRNLGNSADDTSVQGLREEFRRAFKILYEKFRQGAKRSNYFKHNQNFRSNGFHRQQNVEVDTNNDYKDETDDTNKGEQIFSDISSHQRNEQLNQVPVFSENHNSYYQRSSNLEDALNKKSCSPEPNNDSVSEVNSTSSTNNHLEMPSPVPSQDNAIESSEVIACRSNQKSVTELSQSGRHNSMNNKMVSHSNQKMAYATNQKHIGQSNKQSYNHSSNHKSTNGSNRPNRNSDQRFVREARPNFAHISNSIVTPPTSQKESAGSPTLDGQPNQASNVKSEQNNHKPTHLKFSRTCTKSTDENSCKTYSYNGVKVDGNGASVIPSYSTPNISKNDNSVPIIFDSNLLCSNTVNRFFPSGATSIFSQNHTRDDNSATFQRRLSHQSSSDGSNSHTSVNSSNTSYSNNSYQHYNTSNKPQDNYHLSQHQNNVANGEVNNGVNNGNSTYNSVASRNLLNNQKSTSNINSNNLNHSGGPKTNGSRDNNGHYSNNTKIQAGTHSDNRSNGPKVLYSNNMGQGNYSNVMTVNGSNHDNYSHGSKSINNGYQNKDHVNGPKNNGNANYTNNGHYLGGQRSMNGICQNNCFVNNLKMTNGNYQNIDNHMQCPKGSANCGYPDDEKNSPIRISEFNYSNGCNYSDILKSTKGNNFNVNYANVAAKATNVSNNSNNSHSAGRSSNNVSRTTIENITSTNHANDQNYNNVARNANNIKFSSFKNIDGNNSNTPKNLDESGSNTSKVVSANNYSAPKNANVNANNGNINASNQRNNNQPNRKNRKKRAQNATVKKDEINFQQQIQTFQPVSPSQQQQSSSQPKSGQNNNNNNGRKVGPRKSNVYQNPIDISATVAVTGAR